MFPEIAVRWYTFRISEKHSKFPFAHRHLHEVWQEILQHYSGDMLTLRFQMPNRMLHNQFSRFMVMRHLPSF
jgi:hypothetical protein